MHRTVGSKSSRIEKLNNKSRCIAVYLIVYNSSAICSMRIVGDSPVCALAPQYSKVPGDRILLQKNLVFLGI